MISSAQHDLLMLCALRHEDKHLDWSLIARESLRPDGIAALLAGQVLETSPAADQARHLLPLMLKNRSQAQDRVAEELQLPAQLRELGGKGEGERSVAHDQQALRRRLA